MDDTAYFRRREGEERDQAASARIESARRIHQTLAETYAQRVAENRRVTVDELLRE